LVLLNLTGLAVSILLLIKSYKSSNSGDRFCKIIKNGDCTFVINSRFSILLGIDLSEISFIYFLTVFFISISTFTSINEKLNSLGILIFLTLPITILSLYFQSKLGKWCMLCLSITAILWCESLLSFIMLYLNGGFGIYNFPYQQSIQFLIIAILITLTTKISFKNFVETLSIKNDLYRFKRNVEIFKTILEKQRKVDTADSNALFLKPQSDNIKLNFMLIINPYCEICHHFYNELFELRNKYKEQVQIELVFKVYEDLINEGVQDRIVQESLHLIDIYNNSGPEIAFKSLYDLNLEHIKGRYNDRPDNRSGLTNAVPVLIGQNDWCGKHSLEVVPTLLINGHLQPRSYKLKDLDYLLPYL
jgi:uncharacterized membrane protein